MCKEMMAEICKYFLGQRIDQEEWSRKFILGVVDQILVVTHLTKG